MIDRLSVIVLRSVELRKEQRTLACVVEHGSGEQNLRAAERCRIRDLDLFFAKTPGIRGNCQRSRFRRGFGNDVNGGENGVAAIQGRGWSPNNLDLPDQVHVDRKTVAEEQHEVEDVVGHVVAVNHHQHVAVVVAGEIEATHADGFVGPVIGHIESAHRRQGFAERAVTILPDILCRDYSHAGGRVLESLRVEGGSHHLDLHQLVKHSRHWDHCRRLDLSVRLGRPVSGRRPGTAARRSQAPPNMSSRRLMLWFIAHSGENMTYRAFFFVFS